ncbi:MAG: hypothetical protein DMG57_04580 [Acidobacteria bacterium]|nr:MAG: hypothetical protein DMG57_04580 [Acidobacteriota bacterium]
MLWVAIPGHHPDIRNHKMVPIGSNSARRGVSQLWNQNQNLRFIEKRETSKKKACSRFAALAATLQRRWRAPP